MAKNNINDDQTRRKSFRVLGAVLLVVVVGFVLILFRTAGSSAKSTSELATFVAKRGPLTISVLESGTIKAREQIIIKNEVEGRTSIITLIPEGTRVKKGDLLVELDTSTLEDTKIDQEIRVQNAEASYVNSKENLAVVQNQAEADIDKAKLTFEFAQQDLDQYEQGKYPNEKTAAENEITLRQEELKRAEETLTWSQKLYDNKYISQAELMADQLAVTRSKNDLELAQNNLKLLGDFTYHRTMAQLQSDVKQAKMALERTEQKAKADVVQAQADLKAKDAEYQRQKDKLSKIENQLGKTKIYAPADGLAIYATSAQTGGFRGGQQPLEEGQEVRERQELIYLPITESAMVEVPIHESSLEKVRIGLPAVVTVDALPGKKFLGRMDSIAPLPDARSMWMNPDLKVYNSKIYLDESDSSLRTGMSCKAEIIIEQYDDAVYVPVQAVLRVGGEPTVYVVKNKSVEPRKIEIGLDNNRMARIISGLKEGELVLLTPPLKSASVEPGSQMAGAGSPGSTDASDTLKKQINERLEVANGTQPEARRQDRQGPEASSPEASSEPEKMRQRFENMSEEERQKMRQRFENMTEEEREQMRQRFQGSRRRPEQQGEERNQ